MAVTDFGQQIGTTVSQSIHIWGGEETAVPTTLNWLQHAWKMCFSTIEILIRRTSSGLPRPTEHSTHLSTMIWKSCPGAEKDSFLQGAQKFLWQSGSLVMPGGKVKTTKALWERETEDGTETRSVHSERQKVSSFLP